MLSTLRDAFRRKTIKYFVVTMSLATLTAFSGCGDNKAARQGQAEIPVKTMAVIKRDTPTMYEFTGFVEAQKEAKLLPQVTGKIVSKHFNGGDTVTEGQLLFTIDQRTYHANLLNAQARLAAAKAEELRLKQDLERYEKLYEQAAVSKQKFYLTVAQYEMAKATALAAEATLANAAIDMDETEVRAPFTGRIDTSDLSVGNFVSAGQTVLATMSSVNPVKVSFSMSENEYLKLSGTKDGQGHSALEDLTLVLSDGSTYGVKGELTEVDRGVGNGTGTLNIKAKFQNDARRLLPGMFARVQANGGTVKDALLIPQRSVKELLYKKFVFIVGSDNKVEMKEVELGQRVGRLWQVLGGLKGDETLVVEGVQKVNAGSTVKPEAMTEAELSTSQAPEQQADKAADKQAGGK